MSKHNSNPKPGQIGSAEHTAALEAERAPKAPAKVSAFKAVTGLAKATQKAEKARAYLQWAEAEVVKAREAVATAEANLATAKADPAVSRFLS